MGSASNIRLAKKIHEERTAKLKAKVAQQRKGTVGTELQRFIDKGYSKPKPKR